MNIKGAGDFIFNENLILTQKGQTKRTIWELPLSFHPNEGVEMSYNPIGRWKMENDKPILTSAGRGQEFIFKKDPHGEIIKWATNLIKSYQISD
jgi:hypothetical protein